VYKILIRLVPLKLHNRLRGYVARVMATKRAGMEQLFAEMDAYHGSLTLADYKAAFEVLVFAVCKLLSQGYSIDTPLFKFGFGVDGQWTLEPGAHKVRIIAKPGEAAADAVRDLGWERGDVAEDGTPVPMHIVDLSSGAANEELSGGGTARVQGEQLRFDLQDAQQGIFLVNHTATERLVIRKVESASRYLVDLPAQFPQGPCTLEVRTLNETGELRTGVLPWQLIFRNS
jgi:hypothetical protein